MIWVVLVICACPGCGDDLIVCGPGDAGGAGITAQAASPVIAVAWDDLVASANNDCPPAGSAGTGAISLTIEGRQIMPAGAAKFALCLPRPDRIGDGAVALADRTLVQVVNTSAQQSDDCRIEFDRDAPMTDITGTITFSGFCSHGADPAGFSLTVAGTVPVSVICSEFDDGGSGEEPASITLAGTATVTVP